MINDSALEAELSPFVIEASSEYIGRWNRLVSTTNWEKGRIIFQWRQAMQEAEAPVAGYTDESWAEQVGGVSPQHVGRLRRTYERFGDVHQKYPGLYWSHFHTALDWSDAEMWLEGAVQNGWSISQMRQQRWDALGVPAGQQSQESEIFITEADEVEASRGNRLLPESIGEALGEVRDTAVKNKRPADAATFDDGRAGALDSAAFHAESPAAFRPFENLPPMPADLNEAFELFKLAIIGQKLAGWRDIAMDDVLAILDALKQLATAPAK